jgi:putative membrane protein
MVWVVYKWGIDNTSDWPVDDTSGWKFASVPIAFLLVFRNGMAYNRYFEGRNHVGFMVWNARELTRHARQYITGQDEVAMNHRRNLGRLMVAFTKLNRINVRGDEPKGDFTEVEPFLSASEIAALKAAKKNHPVTVLMWIGDVVVAAKDRFIHERVYEAMDTSIGGLLQAFMGMQKLATTPMPFPYVQMILFFVYLWLFTFPIGLVPEFKESAPTVAFLLCFAFLGLNAIGEELEDPFGTDSNDLPLEFFEGACFSATKLMLPGIPMKPLEADEAAKAHGAIPPGVAPFSPVEHKPAIKALGQNPEAGVLHELKSASEYSQLSPSSQQLVKEHFDRFDLSGNGLIDTDNELMQLVTNLMFTLKLGAHMSMLMESTENVSKGGAVLDWNLETFTRWFLATAKLLPL